MFGFRLSHIYKIPNQYRLSLSDTDTSVLLQVITVINMSSVSSEKYRLCVCDTHTVCAEAAASQFKLKQISIVMTSWVGGVKIFRESLLLDLNALKKIVSNSYLM